MIVVDRDTYDGRRLIIENDCGRVALDDDEVADLQARLIEIIADFS